MYMNYEAGYIRQYSEWLWTRWLGLIPIGAQDFLCVIKFRLVVVLIQPCILQVSQTKSKVVALPLPIGHLYGVVPGQRNNFTFTTLPQTYTHTYT